MFMGFGLIFTLFIGGALVYALGWRPGLQQNQTGPLAVGKSALELLNERYARGEIDREAYQQIRQSVEK